MRQKKTFFEPGYGKYLAKKMGIGQNQVVLRQVSVQQYFEEKKSENLQIFYVVIGILGFFSIVIPLCVGKFAIAVFVGMFVAIVFRSGRRMILKKASDEKSRFYQSQGRRRGRR